MKPKPPRDEHTPQWHHMQNMLPRWIEELSGLPGNEIDSAEFDRRIAPYSETDVCLQCRIDAAFGIQERLKASNKRFVNRENSPALSRLGEAGRGNCTCKRPKRR